MPNLRDLQQRFFRSVRARALANPEHADGDLLTTIGARAPLDAAERIDVYAEMYAARLADALGETFGRTAEVLGPERFQRLARDYMATSPSEHPSLRYVGDRFAAFVTQRDDLPAYLTDLARLEWARLEVFDAPDRAPLALESLRRRPPDRWHALELQAIPALMTLRVAWPVHEIWAATPAGTPRRWAPMTTVLRVWRQNFLVYQAPMDADEGAALADLQAGTTFGALCARLEETHGPEAAPRDAAALVLRWVDDGILAEPA